MKKIRIISYILLVVYLISRINKLDFLPIFADEAIYLRWATMIFHDPQQFLFLPMYDGKTPLFIWLLIPITQLYRNNPLLGGRLLVVIFGVLTAWIISKITKLSGGDGRAQIISFSLYTFLPFTFFFDRMSLIDVPLTFMLATAFYFTLLWSKHTIWRNAIFAGFFYGLAILTKTSALFALPIFVWMGVKKVNRRTLPQFLGAGVIAMGMLAVLRISPLFSFLFNRSSDFAFSISDIFSKPFYILQLNIPRIAEWLWIYFTPAFWIILGITSVYAVIRKEWNQSIAELLLLSGLFILPFLISGRLLTSRYLLPSIIWLIPVMSLVISQWFKRQRYIALTMVVAILISGLGFMWPLYTNLNKTKLTTNDKQQYLSEWSAGFGIPESRNFLKERVLSGKQVVVATEGYFGTLPDGLFIYFSETPLLSQMEIFGVGQPIIQTPLELIAKSSRYDEAYLVVNKNRINYNYSVDFDTVGTYDKPNNGSPLLLMRLKK